MEVLIIKHRKREGWCKGREERGVSNVPEKVSQGQTGTDSEYTERLQPQHSTAAGRWADVCSLPPLALIFSVKHKIKLSFETEDEDSHVGSLRRKHKFI